MHYETLGRPEPTALYTKHDHFSASAATHGRRPIELDNAPPAKSTLRMPSPPHRPRPVGHRPRPATSPTAPSSMLASMKRSVSSKLSWSGSKSSPSSSKAPSSGGACGRGRQASRSASRASSQGNSGGSAASACGAAPRLSRHGPLPICSAREPVEKVGQPSPHPTLLPGRRVRWTGAYPPRTALHQAAGQAGVRGIQGLQS